MVGDMALHGAAEEGEAPGVLRDQTFVWHYPTL
jgi:hypothetical protein